MRLPVARPLWIPAFAGMTVVMRVLVQNNHRSFWYTIRVAHPCVIYESGKLPHPMQRNNKDKDRAIIPVAPPILFERTS